MNSGGILFIPKFQKMLIKVNVSVDTKSDKPEHEHILFDYTGKKIAIKYSPKLLFGATICGTFWFETPEQVNSAEHEFAIQLFETEIREGMGARLKLPELNFIPELKLRNFKTIVTIFDEVIDYRDAKKFHFDGTFFRYLPNKSKSKSNERKKSN